MSPRLEELAAREAAAAARRYRIEEPEARALFRDALEVEPGLAERLRGAGSLEEARRWGATRRAVKRARRRIYYRLRRFQGSPEETRSRAEELARALAEGRLDRAEELRRALIEGHASTRERRGAAGELRAAILAAVPAPRSILDVGCGLQPLQWLGPIPPPEPGVAPGAPAVYRALDRDEACLAALRAAAPAYRPVRLEALRVELAGPEAGEISAEPADLGLMMKLVAQVRRQQRALLPALARLPCRYLAVTEAAQALTRRRSIARRELRVLERFAADAGRPILARLEVPGEIGLLLGPREEP